MTPRRNDSDEDEQENAAIGGMVKALFRRFGFLILSVILGGGWATREFAGISGKNSLAEVDRRLVTIERTLLNIKFTQQAQLEAMPAIQRKQVQASVAQSYAAVHTQDGITQDAP